MTIDVNVNGKDDPFQSDIRLPGYFIWPDNAASTRPISESNFLEFVASQHVFVVGIFGKTGNVKAFPSRETSKAGLLDHALQRDVFWIHSDSNDRNEQTRIQGFHDKITGRIYLNLQDSIETAFLFRSVKQIEEEGLQTFLSKSRFNDVKLLLFFFHVCHLIVLYHPDCTLDLSYISLFKALDTVRSKLLPLITASLKNLDGVTLGKEWISQGRTLAPKILFYFATCPIDLRGSKATQEMIKRDGTVSKQSPVRKLEFSLEDQIYQIYRKARILSGSNSNSLFQLPSRDGYVYVEVGNDESQGQDALEDMIKTLLQSLSDSTVEPDLPNLSNLPYFTANGVADSRKERCFSRFLNTHIESMMLGKGNESAVMMPTAQTWYQVSEHLMTIFASSDETSFGLPFDEDKSLNDVARRAAMALSGFSEIEARFSEQRCSKALPQALAAYQEGLPTHYTKEYHNAKLLQAMSIYSQSARGPSSSKFAEKLATECSNHWKNGRQKCEDFSLTGNQCANRKHVLPGQKVTKNDEEQPGGKKRKKPTMPHHSGVKYLSACNCGRRQFNRDDPFNIVDANFNFYANAEQECCQDLQKINFPTFQPPSVIKATNKALAEFGPDPDEDTSIAKALECLEIKSDASISTSKLEQDEETLESLADTSLNRQSSLLDPISHMITKDTPSGKLPMFPSWSLTQIGSSYLYSHNTGLNQPGFLTGSKSLHTWDVPLKTVTWDTIKESWSNLADMLLKKPNFVPKKGESVPLTVKIFLGFEYECLRGHRFLAATPDKAMKSGSAATTKDTGGKLVASDIPLYLKCPCKETRPGQLMRLHVVTPKAPIHVTLHPQIQVTTPNGPIFHPGVTDPVKLPHNSYWVLRLPYVYSGEQGLHPLPSSTTEGPINPGRLLKGCISTTEEFEVK